MKYLPYVPLAVAIVLAFFISGAEDPAKEATLIGWAAILFGLSVALSGVRAVLQGEVLVRTRKAERDEQPVTFWITVVVFRFAVAAALLIAGVWQL